MEYDVIYSYFSQLIEVGKLSRSRALVCYISKKNEKQKMNTPPPGPIHSVHGRSKYGSELYVLQAIPCKEKHVGVIRIIIEKRNSVRVKNTTLCNPNIVIHNKLIKTFKIYKI